MAVYQDITDYCEEGVYYNDGFYDSILPYWDPIPDLTTCQQRCIAEHGAKFFWYCPDHPDGRSVVVQSLPYGSEGVRTWESFI